MPNNDTPATPREDIRRRLAARDAEFWKALPVLDKAIEAAAAAFKEATEIERLARRAHVLATKNRRAAIRANSEADGADLAQLRATAPAAVIDALADVHQEAGRARHGDNPVMVFALESAVAELEALLLEDGDNMAARVSEVLDRVPQRVQWRTSYGELLKARPTVSGGRLSPGGEAVEQALTSLRAVDPLGKDAPKRIAEIMRPTRIYLQQVAFR